ncbi:MAG: phBC6A51 family helix-turn-helix protein [Candidatus Merdivicinus sp.]|jgi:hypothetical protein
MTPKQKRAIAALTGMDAEQAAIDAAKAAGVSLETICSWLTDGEFRRQFKELADRESDAERAAVWRALVEQCASGNLAAIKLYFELKDGSALKRSAKSSDSIKIIDDI